MRAAGWLGLVCFALIVVAGLIEPLWDFPATTASPDEVRTYVADNRDGFLWSLVIFSVGMGLFLAFAAVLWTELRRRGVSEALAAVFGAGSLSLVTVVFAGFTPTFVLAYRAPDVEAPRELYDLSFGLLALSGVPTALATAAFAAIVFSSRVLPAWTGWLAAVAAVAHVVIVGSFLVDSGFFSLEGGVIVAIPATMFLWIAGTSVAALRTER